MFLHLPKKPTELQHFAAIAAKVSFPSFGVPPFAFRGLRSVLFELGHVSQAIFAGLPFPLLTVQLPTIKFATGDIVRNFGDQFLYN